MANVARRGGFKKAGRRTFAKAARKAAASQLYLKGKTQQQIGQALGVDQKTISRDLSEAHDTLLAIPVENLSQLREKRLNALDEMEKELRDEWQRSKLPTSSTNVVQEVQDDPQGGQPRAVGRRRLSKTTTERTADPRYFSLLLSIEQERNKLLGTYAPIKSAATDPEGNPAASPLVGDVLIINVGGDD